MTVVSELGMWSLDVATGVLSCSPEMLAMLELPAADREAWLARVHPDDQARLAAALAAGAAFELDCRIGDKQSTHVRARRIGGSLVGTCEGLEAHLERALVDRIASVSTFSASIAHELNNPLAIAVANLELIRDALGAERTLDEMMTDAKVSLGRIQSIIRSLRTFTRGEHDAVEPVDLEGVLESAITVANHEIVRRARLVRDFVPLPAVRAIEAPLGHVFVNLLVNAAQAIPAGAIERHEIRVATRVMAGPRVAVEIRDTGSGIARENHARIFEPFFTTKPIGQGVGLGLAVCRNVVRSFGGEITFDSAPTGTVFRVSLPIAPRRVEGAPVRTPVTTTSSRVLLVDDEVLFTNALRRLLGPDHDITVSNTAQSAIELFEAGERFDVVLCDLMMPGLGGMGLYQAVGAIAPDQPRRFIFITGGASTPAAQQFLERVPNPCFEKPCDFNELRAAVNRVGCEKLPA